LLWLRYEEVGKDAPFAFYIVHDLPSGFRGLVVAGIFATAMGSLSTALNSLATIYTRDWFLRKRRPNASEEESLRCAKRSTVWFSVALVVIGCLTAYAKIVLKARIIPIVLGVFGYTYGSLLGVFLLGLLTKRGSERGNLIAMTTGLLAVALEARLVADGGVSLAHFLRRKRDLRRRGCISPTGEFERKPLSQLAHRNRQ
jgi:SSS family solute:Na+ symporter